MSKYSDDFKLTIVKEYFESPLGFRRLAKKYDIPSKTSIERWINSYKVFGEEGLRKKRSKKTYSVQFKLHVLNFIKKTGTSYQDAAIKFKVTDPSIIVNWNRIFLKESIEGLKGKTRGMPYMPKKRKSKQSKQSNVISREEKLERENELLRLEVAYLKKLKAFQANPNAYLEKHKPR